MSSPDGSVLDRLRQPEYTGENRCVPCTVLNLAIAVVVSALVGRRRRALGLLVLGVSAGLVYLRGYLIPGTPELTKRYLPRRVLRAFGKDPVAERLEDEFVTDVDERPGASANGGVATRENGHATPASEDDAASDAGDETAIAADDGTDAAVDDDEPEFRTLKKIQQLEENEVDAESYLREAGVIEPGEADGSELTDGYVFTDEFRELAWEHVAEDLAVDRERVAPIFEIDPEEMADKERDYPAYRVGVRVRKWPSDAALALDVASYEAIGEFADDWDEVPIEQRVDVVEWLRGFYDECPACGGAVAFSDDVIESCCGQFNVKSLSCTDCGVHLREFDPTKIGDRYDLRGIVP